jgi:hypothetical protein
MTGRFEMVRGDFGNVTDRTGLRERPLQENSNAHLRPIAAS